MKRKPYVVVLMNSGVMYRSRGVGGLLRVTFRVWVREGHVEFDVCTRKRQFMSTHDPRGRDGRAEA